jgi:hypothetical protein
MKKTLFYENNVKREKKKPLKLAKEKSSTSDKI